MTENERVAAYIESLNGGNSGFLAELEHEAVMDRIPIIRPQVQSLLRTIIAGLKPQSILEVGTAVGFSAILMAQCAPQDCRITTIENYGKRIPAARENFKRSGLADRITLIEGDAADILRELRSGETKTGKSSDEVNNTQSDSIRIIETSETILTDRLCYDLIFMDAAKGQYLNFFEDVMALLRAGGILVSDNVLQDGDIIQSRFAVRRRDRTIHARMREYLYVLTHDERLSTTILPMGDGVTVSVRT